LTKAYMLFLARWARKLSRKETAEAFHTSWEQVCFAVEYVGGWGLEHGTLGPSGAIGVDEIQYAKGHKYLTLVYQIDPGIIRLLWVGRERTQASFQQFFTLMGKELAAQIQFVCSDMWQPYLDVIRHNCSQALHILDRFHVVAKMNKALDEVRAAESRKMAQDGHEPLLKKSRGCVLKRQENLTSQRKIRLRDLLRYNLQTVRAYLLKEDYQQFWDYNSPAWAGKFLDFWCFQTMRSRIEAMKKIDPHAAHSPRAAAQLFQGPQAVLQRGYRGPKQQGQSNHEKILWLSHLPHPGTRAVSFTWQTARTGAYPRILLTNHTIEGDALPGGRARAAPGLRPSGLAGMGRFARYWCLIALLHICIKMFGRCPDMRPNWNVLSKTRRVWWPSQKAGQRRRAPWSVRGSFWLAWRARRFSRSLGN
jgi:hypothetical protein